MHIQHFLLPCPPSARKMLQLFGDLLQRRNERGDTSLLKSPSSGSQEDHGTRGIHVRSHHPEAIQNSSFSCPHSGWRDDYLAKLGKIIKMITHLIYKASICHSHTRGSALKHSCKTINFTARSDPTQA